MSQIILDSANDLIQGDFDNATLSQRTRLQTSTTNATTGVYVVPNGTANSASVQVSNAADPTNASKVVVATNGSTDTQIVSGANGSGTYLPLSFYTNNDIRFQMGNAGELNVRTGPGTVSSGTSGQVLTSGGPGAGVSWATPPSPQIQTELFTAPGTWTKPATVTQVRVSVVGGGGGGSFRSPGPSAPGGDGGFAQAICPVSGPVAITIGAGGAGGLTGPTGSAGGSGGTSSFGPLVSCTGGTGGSGTPGVAPTSGTGTVSTGTAIRTASSAAGGTIFAGNRQATNNPAAVTFSTSSLLGAGQGGTGSITLPAGPGGGGTGGAILVEFVG